MSQPEIVVSGVYHVELSEKLFAETMEMKFGGVDLSESQRQEAEESIRDELSSVALFDVLVSNPDELFDVGHFHQPGSTQTAYREAYLSPDGTSVLSWFEPPEGGSFRVAFFLHFFDPAKPLITSYGMIPVPPLQVMPEALKELMPYEPVD